MMQAKTSREPVDAIDVSDRMRDRCDDDTVVRLMDSIQRIGLQTPISVRWVGDSLMLVAGRHRLEAVRRLGWDMVDCTMLTGTDDEARMWEIAENLHRAELTVLERDEHIAEWVRLAGVCKGAQLAPPGGAQPNDKGIKAASRELGIERTAAQRATKVAGLSPEAKAAAKETGLDKNQSALLKVANEAPEEQAAKVRQIAEDRDAAAETKKAAKAKRETKPVKPAPGPLNDIETEEKWITTIMAVWNRGSAQWRERFLEIVDTAVFDRTDAA